MLTNSIYAQVRLEQNNFYSNYIQVVPGYQYNQYYTLKRAHLYLNSKYEDTNQYMGRDKLFFNIVIPPCEVAMRMLNVDTKNIRLWPTNPKSYFSTYLLEKELKLWLKDNKMARILNQIAEEAPRYGSVVLEKTKDGAELVDLRKLINDPTVENIQDSRFITTIHYMTETELRDSGWDNVETAIDRFANTSSMESFEDQYGNLNQIQTTPYIKVWKRYGEVPTWWIDSKAKPGTTAGDKLVKSVFIIAGADRFALNAEGKPTGEMGVTLFKSKWYKKWPYKDFHYTKIKGRWMGLGVTEMLFDAQVRMNELKNQKRISMELSSMHLLQTPDRTIVRNALTDLQNGDIIVSPNGITPIPLEERNLPAFENEEESYMGQVDRLSFAYEAIRGQQADNQTTLGQTQIAVAQSSSVYAFKRENLQIFLREYFNELVLPQLMKDLTPDHIMRFTGTAQELQVLDQAAGDLAANDYIKQKIVKGHFVAPEEVEFLKQIKVKEYQKLGESRFLQIKKNFYDDADFEFDFLIGNEQADPATMTQNYQAVLSELVEAQQTGALNDPRVKLVFSKWAEQMGINQAEFDQADQQSGAQQLQAQQQPNGQQNQQSSAGGGQNIQQPQKQAASVNTS
jgi:hypothetical protein